MSTDTIGVKQSYLQCRCIGVCRIVLFEEFTDDTISLNVGYRMMR